MFNGQGALLHFCDRYALIADIIGTASKNDLRLVIVRPKPRTISEGEKGVLKASERGRVGFAEKDQVICKHEMSEFKIFAVGMEMEFRTSANSGQKTRKVIH